MATTLLRWWMICMIHTFVKHLMPLLWSATNYYTLDANWVEDSWIVGIRPRGNENYGTVEPINVWQCLFFKVAVGTNSQTFRVQEQQWFPFQHQKCGDCSRRIVLLDTNGQVVSRCVWRGCRLQHEQRRHQPHHCWSFEILLWTKHDLYSGCSCCDECVSRQGEPSSVERAAGVSNGSVSNMHRK